MESPFVERFPWQKVAKALAVAAFIAWGVGFVAGLVVRLVVAAFQ